MKGLQYGKYRFSCRLNADGIMPQYKGSTFRGVFGIALKKVVCALKREECDTCLLKKRCVYATVFETPTALEPPEELRLSVPPHPFVIEPPMTEQMEFRSGETFDCALILFGNVNSHLPYFIYAFDRIGKIGNLSDHTENSIRVSLTMEAPLRLKFKNRIKADLPFHVLARAMLRRISSLFACYAGGEPDLDYKGLLKRAERIKITGNSLRWHSWERYSNRQKQRMPLGGMMGAVTYEGKLGEYLPLLDFCSKAHIGKNTSFGLGKIRPEILT